MKIIAIPSKAGSMKNNSPDMGVDEIIKNLSHFFVSESGFKKKFDIERVNVQNNNLSETNKNIYEKIKKTNGFFAALGGDHSVTYSILKALGKNERITLVLFDAHPDCENNFSPPTYEDFARVALEEGIVENIIMLGIRNWSENEYNFIKSRKINVFSSKEIHSRGIRNTIHDLMGLIKSKNFYLSIDIDVVDPAFAPGTGWTEPGGISSREIIYCIQKLSKLSGFRAMDIVEVDPKRDINSMTSKLASKILWEAGNG